MSQHGRMHQRYYKDDRNYYHDSRYISSSRYNEVYSPLVAGSADSTDTEPHDKAIIRAKNAKYKYSNDKKIKGDKHKTLFIARLNKDTEEDIVKKCFEKFGAISHFRLVRDIVTGRSRGYGFVTYTRERDFNYAWKHGNGMIIENSKILVEHERERIMTGWVPRRLGGGLGGKKESGQLRFGGRDRPHKRRY